MKSSKKPSQNFFKRILNYWPVFFILIIICSFFWKVFLKNLAPLPGDFIVGVYYPWLDYKWGFPAGVPVKNPITTDVVSLIYPEQMLAVDLLRSGAWPMWNSTILAGTPLLANLQAISLPTAFIYFLTDKLTGWSFQVISAHFLAALFTYVLLRHWKVSKLGSITAGIIFSFSGFNMIFSQWNGHTLSAAFIPLILYFQDNWQLSSKSKYAIGLSISICLQLISGYPQVTLYTVAAMALLWLVKSNKKLSLNTLSLGAYSLLGIGLASFFLLPAIELWSLSQRSFEPHPFEWAFLPWQKIITFIAPDYFGNHATANWWGPQDYTSNTAFIGTVAFILASLGLTKIKNNKNVWFIGLLILVSLTFAFPTFPSVYIWKHNILGMRASSAHRITVLFNLGIALLAGFGVNNLLANNRIKIKKHLLLPAVIILIFIPNAPIIGVRNLIFPAAVFIISSILLLIITKTQKVKPLLLTGVLILLITELFRFGYKFTPFSPKQFIYPDTPVLSFLKNQQQPFRVTGNSVIAVNLKTPYGLDSLEGYETIHPLTISEFLSALNGEKVGENPVGRYGHVNNDTSHLLDLVNTKYYLTQSDDTKRFDKDRFKKIFEDKSVSVFESSSVLPRSFMVYNWQVETDTIKTLEKLIDPTFPIADKIIIGTKAPTSINRFINVKPVNTVKYLSYFEQQSILKVETEKSGLLFTSDTFYPGWVARIDGVETEILKANHNFRAIEIPAGSHTVEYSYEPESLQNGVKLSLFSLLALMFLSIFSSILVPDVKK